MLQSQVEPLDVEPSLTLSPPCPCPVCGTPILLDVYPYYDEKARTLHLLGDVDVEFTPCEGAIFGLLWKRRNSTLISSKETLHREIYGSPPSGGPEIKIIDIFLCKIRKKLAQHNSGYRILNVWAAGYVIRPEGK